MRHRIDHGRVNYFPNTLANNSPMPAPASEGGYVTYPEPVAGPKVRERGPRFRDYFSQATLFWNSMGPGERLHLIDAARFELSRVESPVVRQRMVCLLDLIDRELATRVAQQIGVVPPTGEPQVILDAAGDPIERRTFDGPTVERSPALSMENTQKNSIRSRRVAVLVAPGVDAVGVENARKPLEAAGAHLDVIAGMLGAVPGADGTLVPVDKHALAASSVMYDAVLVPGGAASVQALLQQGAALEFVAEAYRHAKPIGAVGEGVELLREARVPVSDESAADGVVVGQATDVQAFADAFAAAIAQHRFPLRQQLVAEATKSP
jgi:catalase